MSDREAGFKEGIEVSARLADKIAQGVLSGHVLPSCANPILVSSALTILAEEIRNLEPESQGSQRQSS
jgi:hypothetical protein